MRSYITVVEGVTTPPKPHTEGRLITMIKTCGKAVDNEIEIEILNSIKGLGTEATPRGIIETIKRHEFFEVKKHCGYYA